MEGIFTTGLHQVFVRTNTSSFQSFAGNLFVLAGNKVDTQRKFVNLRLLATKIVDTNLRVWHTTTEARLRVRLVLTVAVAALNKNQ